MNKEWISALRKPAGAFLRLMREESGTTAVIFGVSAGALLIAGGIAVDYARSLTVEASIQQALDAAVLAGVSGQRTNPQKLEAAEQSFLANRPDMSPPVSAKFKYQNNQLIGEAAANMETTLMKVAGMNEMHIAVKSAATAEVLREPMCLMAMHPTRKHTLELDGDVSIYGPDCNMYGNSNHPYDVVDPHSPTNFVTVKSVQAVGGGHHYLENVTPPVEFASEVIDDPLADLHKPSAGPCLKTAFAISGGTTTLPAGRYCNGLKITNGASVTLEKGGTYIISGGTFTIDDHSTVTGEEIAIFMWDANANLVWKESTVKLSAKKSGEYAGLVIFGSQNTDNTLYKSTVDLHGALYMPNGAFDWTNEGTPAITAKWSAFITDGFSWHGDGTINMNFDLAHSDVPYPHQLRVIPRAGSPRLIN
jgi:Flp pilus assembly protein TadG